MTFTLLTQVNSKEGTHLRANPAEIPEARLDELETEVQYHIADGHSPITLDLASVGESTIHLPRSLKYLGRRAEDCGKTLEVKNYRV